MSEPTRRELDLERRYAVLGRRFERLRKQNLILFLVGILLLCGVGFVVHEQDVQCRADNVAHRSFNDLVDQSILNALRTSGLTESQKADAISKDRGFHQRIADCPIL